MKELMIMYHPVKKEIHFLAKVKGEFLEVPYKICPNLIPYSPENGEFLLQNQGNKFFNDIYEQFSNEKISLVFKGTQVDYEDFCEKIAEYNKTTGEDRFTISNFIELPSVTEIFSRISDFCDETLNLFDTELKDSEIQQSFQNRKQEFFKKREQMSCSDINLCLVGTYSSGKSTFINTLIGRRILPESINSETAKMFRIRNAMNPSVTFFLCSSESSQPNKVTLSWNETKKKFVFESERPCETTKRKIQNEINNALVFHLQRHEQLYQILKSINELPNAVSDDATEYVDGIIDVNYPSQLDPNLNFTFYDTPGTDSNSNEHLLVLQKALQQQTNSILIVIYEPTKMEGTGNSTLYKLIHSSRESVDTKDQVHIDLSRSLHIINQADTRSLSDLTNLKNKKVGISLKETDKIYNEQAEYIDLATERLFFVSSKAAYIAKAIEANIDTEDERLWLANHRNEINNTPVMDPLLTKGEESEIETGMYFKLNKMANADNDTQRLLEDCMEELKKCDEPNDNSLYPILHRVYVNSGMFAVEKEIIRYGQKYALAVKAKGLYDSISSVVNFIRDDYKAIEAQARLSKEQISQNIKTMKTTMVEDIDKACAEYLEDLNPKSIYSRFLEVQAFTEIIEARKAQASKIADKMKWIAIRPEVFEEKNNLIRQELNRYLMEIDEYYKVNREIILKLQIEDLRNRLVKTITGYQGIDEELVRRIANVSDTQIPPSSLKALRMDEYINKQKAIFIFSTNDKKSYKNDIEAMFASTTMQQYESYMAEIIAVAKAKTAELKTEFKNNIDTISSNLEFLINDEKEATKMQEKAKAVLELVDARDKELNQRIWGELK
ncbi:MAG: dynamin family protein [Lachnospiraceae bacterium]|nr:dynamin family protein [Lachnospiraceae bacterium]MBQ3907315.1 dynamin family protein [Lachnospiraceae bacterium]